ncbi:hypothetical protein C2E23DRAFT_881392 [Lenzites betulinus]|nr:hypothetical protein C2E23DRAFT_881392 [Lenzites betulinus]
MSYTTGSYYNPPQAPGFRVHTDLTTELGGRILPHGDDVDEFIDDLLPCSTPFTRNDDLSDAFSNYQPGAGREVQEGPNVASGFTKLVSQFPDDKQTHHHHTSPDLCVSFPGQPLYRAWQSIAMVVECKGEDWQDPFPKHGDERKRSVKQLAINARNILLAHGALAAFVIGVYGHTVRLARFDHTCALVSPAFTINTNAGKKTLQKFLWHFVHPVVGGASSVAGSDPTVMKLTQGDREWIKKELEKAKARVAKNWKDHMGETLKGRRIEVYDDQTGRCVPYLLYHLVDVNARLFSRATMVWRAIEDRRMCSNGRLVEDPTRTSPVKPQIVKEAWRQLLRNSEIMFYQRLHNRIDPEEWVGLAKMVYGGDIGDFERVWWEGMSRRRKVVTNTPDAAPEAMLPSGTPSIYSLSSQLFCSTGSSASPLVTSVESPTEYVPRHNFPLGRPQHETYSWRLVFGERAEPLERSHVRMVIDDVGRPLTEFTSTRELVLAVRDAIKGHALALGDARILHRDISVGNILIADEPKPEHETGPTYTGFLHDFDHSRMLYLGPEEGSEQRQGTPYFMACELLDRMADHDPQQDPIVSLEVMTN